MLLLLKMLFIKTTPCPCTSLFTQMIITLDISEFKLNDLPYNQNLKSAQFCLSPVVRWYLQLDELFYSHLFINVFYDVPMHYFMAVDIFVKPWYLPRAPSQCGARGRRCQCGHGKNGLINPIFYYFIAHHCRAGWNGLSANLRFAVCELNILFAKFDVLIM